MRIGLFGGSFNPPHDAHRAVSLFAMKRLQLDQVWWLVTPGNPLKDTAGLPPLLQRVAAAQRVARHPRIRVTGLEVAIHTRFSCDTIAALRRMCPGAHFVWLMGADNLPQFHRWRSWRRIATLVPIAVVDRPGNGLSATAWLVPQALRLARIAESDAAALARRKPPVWMFLHGLRLPLSSTALRRKIIRRTG